MFLCGDVVKNLKQNFMLGALCSKTLINMQKSEPTKTTA